MFATPYRKKPSLLQIAALEAACQPGHAFGDNADTSFVLWRQAVIIIASFVQYLKRYLTQENNSKTKSTRQKLSRGRRLMIVTTDGSAVPNALRWNFIEPPSEVRTSGLSLTVDKVEAVRLFGGE